MQGVPWDGGEEESSAGSGLGRASLSQMPGGVQLPVLPVFRCTPGCEAGMARRGKPGAVLEAEGKERGKHWIS